MDKIKVLFITNYPAPYRVGFFNLLGQSVDLTVTFSEKPEDQKHRDKDWFNTDYKSFNAIFLQKKIRIGRMVVNTDIIDEVKKPYDIIIMGGYSNPTFIYAIEYMNLHKISFYMEIDGGLIKAESKINRVIKKHFISSAKGWFSSGSVSDKYLLHYGAKENKIFHYPFTSLKAADIREVSEKDPDKKEQYRKELGIGETRVLICVGQFIYRKGIDVLINSAKYLDEDIGIYIIGGVPTDEFLELVEVNNLKNIHFPGFKRKTELKKYYASADVFVMPTREDIWGLVVNEALCYGLPVISTDRCVAALELIRDNINGYVVPVDDVISLADGIRTVLAGDLEEMSRQAKESIKRYTIEEMVDSHLEHFARIRKEQ